MKNILTIFMICILLAGCVAPSESTEPTVFTMTQTDPMEAPTEITAPVLLTYQIYLPNENADGFDIKTAEAPQISADIILAELQARGVLPETVAILAFGSEDNQLNIDFNQAFGDLVCSMGTSGELMIVGSVVNTFLSAFQAESVYFTVEGQILESGHVIYDFPIPFTE